MIAHDAGLIVADAGELRLAVSAGGIAAREIAFGRGIACGCIGAAAGLGIVGLTTGQPGYGGPVFALVLAAALWAAVARIWRPVPSVVIGAWGITDWLGAMADRLEAQEEVGNG